MKMIDLCENHKSKFGGVLANGFAPGRVNLIGEYTDFNDGLVLPMPLPLGVYIVISNGPKGMLVAYSEQFKSQTKRVIGEKANGDWTDYLLGVLKVIGLDKSIGLCISVYSDLPVGASVSSSAALQVAMLRALQKMFNLNFSDVEIAKLAQKAENEFVGVQCGLMDQMVISVGKKKSALLFDIQSGKTENFEFFKDINLITIHSGVSRKLKENAYNDRRDSCQRASIDMKLNSLRDAKLSDLHKVNNDDDRIKAHHVITENLRVSKCVNALKENNAKLFGSIMYEGHESLSQDFCVSTEKMNRMVSFAKDFGALGARMTGAGFGGCIVVLAEHECSKKLVQELRNSISGTWVVSDMKF
ncbi:galactokinase [Amylibacter sp.]|jgi:galactokinase|nr:galactokinase [Amylibacter sp.]MDB2472500.1 galactokinase [Amylibacter sp.]MDB2472507.1 galactokinase [Amylibacter sp.]|tara:strand:- start:973 stop:2046 length:1074 start_codon:yes stop_codon:yes gene_type:complete